MHFICYYKVKLTLLYGHSTKEAIKINNLISDLRKDAGLTQQELASRLEVTRQTIISLESGRYNPSLTLAWKISRLFGKTIEEVFIFEEESI